MPSPEDFLKIMTSRFTLKRETEEQLLKVLKIVPGQKEKESTVKGNSNSAPTSALEIPGSSGTLVLNVCGGNCNITINNNHKL